MAIENKRASTTYGIRASPIKKKVLKKSNDEKTQEVLNLENNNINHRERNLNNDTQIEMDEMTRVLNQQRFETRRNSDLEEIEIFNENMKQNIINLEKNTSMNIIEKDRRKSKSSCNDVDEKNNEISVSTSSPSKLITKPQKLGKYSHETKSSKIRSKSTEDKKRHIKTIENTPQVELMNSLKGKERIIMAKENKKHKKTFTKRQEKEKELEQLQLMNNEKSNNLITNNSDECVNDNNNNQLLIVKQQETQTDKKSYEKLTKSSISRSDKSKHEEQMTHLEKINKKNIKGKINTSQENKLLSEVYKKRGK